MSLVTRNEDEGMTTFDTEDLGLATALSAMGYEIIFMHPIGCCSGRVVFHFAATSHIEQDAEDYWDGMLQVDPHEYWHEYNTLSSYIYKVLCHED